MRVTIAFLIDVLNDRYQEQVLAGAIRAAEDLDANIICFAGGAFKIPDMYFLPRQALYELIDTDRIQGIVSLTGTLCMYTTTTEQLEFYRSFSPLPVVSIGIPLPGIPSVLIDNFKGMYEMIAHLIDRHGCRRVAFVCGPENNAEALIRFDAYRKVLEDRAIPFDPLLVSPGTFYVGSGRDAIELFLDKRNIRPDAVVGANDLMALDVMKELRKRGVRVPEDIAVAGFDDTFESRYVRPSLSTVFQPIYSVGYSALISIVSILREGKTAENIIIPTGLCFRQSCGCTSQSESAAIKSRGCDFHTVNNGTGSEYRKGMQDAIALSITTYFDSLAPDIVSRWSAILAAAIGPDIEKNEEKCFLIAFDEVLNDTERYKVDILTWRIIVFTFFEKIKGFVSEDRKRFINYLTISAFSLVEKLVAEYRSFFYTLKENQVLSLYHLSQKLITAFNRKKLNDIIDEEFPLFGIRMCSIAEYQQETSPRTARIVIEHSGDPEKRESLPTNEYPAKKIFPAGLESVTRRFSFIVMALYFKDEQIGFVVFEGDNLDGMVYETITLELSSALKGAGLVEQVQSHADYLEKKIIDRTRDLRESNRNLTQEILERTAIEKALFQEKERALVTLESIGDGIITTDNEGIVTYVNPVAENLSGHGNSEASGRLVHEILHVRYESTDKPLDDLVRRVLLEKRIIKITDFCTLKGKDDSEYAVTISAAPIRSKENEIKGVVLIVHDISETHRMSKQLSYQSTHDLLTGLFNRIEFERIISDSIEVSHTRKSDIVLCIIDLDDFKLINNTHGSLAGDELLRYVSASIQKSVRGSDVIARITGDQFGILFFGCPIKQAEILGKQIIADLNRNNFSWLEHRFKVRASVGIVNIDTMGENIAGVMSAGHLSCYIAKKKGGNRLHVYNKDDSELIKYQSEILFLPQIAKALEENRFCLYFQSIVPLSEERKNNLHCEILVRMIDEKGNLLLPGVFIPIAERFNMMPAIDKWVISHFFQYLASPEVRNNSKFVRYGINLSGSSLNTEDFCPFIIEELNRFGIPPELICFEITETAALSHFSRIRLFINGLRSAGCTFALDDFGSGWTSFNYLKMIPVDYLKIDGSYVKGIAASELDYSLVETMNHIGHTLKLSTIAEFVETEEILTRLKTIGVDFAQGYAIARPVPLISHSLE